MSHRRTRLAASACWLIGLFLLVSPALGDAFDDRPINLPDPTTSQEATATTDAAPVTGPSVTRVLASLTLVAALIVGLGIAWKKVSQTAGKAAGAAAVSLIGRTVITPRHQVMVLKVGHRLVVVGDAGHGMQPLCEISDPEEVASVLATCGKASAEFDSIKADAFAATLDEATLDDTLYEHPIESESNVEQLVGEDVRSLIARVKGLTVQHAAEPEGGRA